MVALIDAVTSFERAHNLRQDFNLFEAVFMGQQEIRHSRFLAFLLNPYAAHGLRDLFLRRFLTTVVADHPTRSVTRLDVAIGDLGGAIVECERHHFDIVIELPRMELLVVVENKIGAKESEEQLARYRDDAQGTYDQYEVLGCFLTPEGYEGADERWGVLSYRDIATELAQLIELAVVSNESRLVIEHYIRLIERKIVTSTKIIDACKKIYRDHKVAFDLIIRHGQVSPLAMAFDQFNSGVRQDLAQEAVRTDTIFFVFEDWKRSLQALPAVKGAWPSNYPVLLWFKKDGEKLQLTFEVGPFNGDAASERARFVADVRSALKLKQPKPGGKGNGVIYTRVRTEKVKVGDDPSVEDLVTAMGSLLDRIKAEEIKAAVLAAIPSDLSPQV